MYMYRYIFMQHLKNVGAISQVSQVYFNLTPLSKQGYTEIKNMIYSETLKTPIRKFLIFKIDKTVSK